MARIVLDASFLMPLSTAFMIIAVVAWAVAFAGLVDSRLTPTARRTAARP